MKNPYANVPYDQLPPIFQGFVYLHTDGKVIWKNTEPDIVELNESPFVVTWWTKLEVGATPQHYFNWLKELSHDYGMSREAVIALGEEQNIGEYYPHYQEQL